MVNHVVHCSSVVLHQADVVQRCDENPGIVVVTCPWNDNVGHVYTGVPPYVAMLQELTLLRTKQINLIDGFVNKVKTALEEYGVDRVKTALEEYGVDSEWLTVENLNWILDCFRDELNVQLWTFGNGSQSAVVEHEHVETGENYKIHTHSGQLSWVPVDWCFPCCSIFDLWWQWWIGDQVRQVLLSGYFQEKMLPF